MSKIEDPINIVVGTFNPTKIKPVERVFSHYYSDALVYRVHVSSGVSEQPLSDEEIFEGAENRARRALEASAFAHMGVGIESGFARFRDRWLERAGVVIVDRKGMMGVGVSSGPSIPESAVLMKDLLEGKTVDQVVEELLGIEKIGNKQGLFGLITNGRVTRSDSIEHGVAFALAPFLHPELF
jgi:inosine/xanthosine triphosphatase